MANAADPDAFCDDSRNPDYFRGNTGSFILQNASVNYMDAIRRIIVPSLVMNLLIAIPIYAFLNDVVNTIISMRMPNERKPK